MKRLLASLGIVAVVIFGGTGTALVTASQTQAINVFHECDPGDANANSDICKAHNKDNLIGGVVKNVINTLLFIIAIIAVIVIIVGAIRFVTSSGDPQQAASARNTIIYAVVGLVIAIMAYAIVNFVLAKIGGS